KMKSARNQFEAAQRIRESALKRDASNSKLRRDLAKGFYNLGNLDCAEGLASEAEGHFTQATQVFEELGADEPSDLDHPKLLALCYRLLGDIARPAPKGEMTSEDKGEQAEQARRAREWYERALAQLSVLAAQNPDVIDYQTEQAGILMNLALLEIQVNNSAGGFAALERARGILAPLV